MLIFDELNTDEIVYIVNCSGPITILDTKILSINYETGMIKIMIVDSDLTFTVEFDKVKETVFKDKEAATAYLIKLVFSETNNYISSLTDGVVSDYYDLDTLIKKYSDSHPEFFI